MIVNLQKSVKEAIVLDNEDMRLIQGGGAAASFPCTVVEVTVQHVPKKFQQLRNAWILRE